MSLTVEQKSDKFWQLIYAAQAEANKKWHSLDDFEAWLRAWGGNLQSGSRRKKNFIVRSFVAKGRRMSYAIPVEFVDKCLVLGAIP